MTAVAPLLVRPRAPLPRANPAAKLLAVTALSVAAFAAVDPVTPAVLLVAEALVLPFCGLRVPVLCRRSWPVLVGAAGVAVANALFGTGGGALLLDLGPLTMTTGSVAGGLAIMLRVLAIALPGVVVLAVTDPVDIADSLVQQWRVPARFAYGVLAAVRLLPLLGDEWRTIGMARRARGVQAGGDPILAVRLLGGRIFTLLVGAIRRATRLAAAMDARGFDATVPRTHARPQVVGTSDRVLVVAAVLIGVTALVISRLAGTLDLLVG